MTTIDGKDTGMWGLEALDGAYGSLLKYPKRKTVNFTNYAEVDGITPDVRKVEFEPKQVTVEFGMVAGSGSAFRQHYDSFYAEMMRDGYRNIDFGHGLVHQLRFEKGSGFRTHSFFRIDRKVAKISISMIEDKTPVGQSVTSPAGGIGLKGYYAINGIDFGDFGICPDAEAGRVLIYDDVKAPFFDGRNYYPDDKKIKHREISLPLWMFGKTVAEFIANYQAFFNQWAKPGLQTLYAGEAGRTFDVYYTNCTSYSVMFDRFGRAGAKFAISFVITNKII